MINLKGVGFNLIIFSSLAIVSIVVFLLILNSIIPNFMGRSLCKVYHIIIAFPLPKQLKPHIPGCSLYPEMERIILEEESSNAQTLTYYIEKCWDKSQEGRSGQSFICYELFLKKVPREFNYENILTELKDEGKIEWLSGPIEGSDITVIIKYNSETGKIEFIGTDIITSTTTSAAMISTTTKSTSTTTSSIATTSTTTPGALQVKVFLLIFNPIIESNGGQKLTEIKGWYDPEILTQSYIQDIKDVSGSFVDYKIEEKIEIDDIPKKEDGFDYTDEIYLECTNNPSSCHSPDWVDYHSILNDYNICNKLNNGKIDELWIWGGPWFGYYEARMAGTGSWYTNGPVLTGTSCDRPLHIMGFNYERTENFMLESFSHRVEGTIQHFVGLSEWDKFDGQRYRYSHSYNCDPNDGRPPIDTVNAHCGNVHFTPNSQCHYEYDSSEKVLSDCDDWINYPHLIGAKKETDCTEWGCNHYGYMKWWLSHLPKNSGETNGIFNNWWKYVVG